MPDDTDALRTRLVDAGAREFYRDQRSGLYMDRENLPNARDKRLARVILDAFLAVTDATECPECRGHGAFMEADNDEGGGAHEIDCGRCHGSGRVPAGSVLARYLVARDPQAVMDSLVGSGALRWEGKYLTWRSTADNETSMWSNAPVVDKEQPW